MFNTTKCLLLMTFLIASTIPTSCLADWASMSTPAKHGVVALGVGVAGFLGNGAAHYFDISIAPKACGQRYAAMMNAAASLALLYSAGAICVDSYQMKKEDRDWVDSYLPSVALGAAVFFTGSTIQQMLYYYNHPFAK